MGLFSAVRKYFQKRNTDKFLVKCAKEIGAHQYGWVNVKDLKYYDKVREMCAANYCGRYGTNWACPPGTGTLDERKALNDVFRKMMLISAIYDLPDKELGADAYEDPDVMRCMRDFSGKMRTFQELVEKRVDDFIIYTNGGCNICKKCTYPDAPCRFPDKLQPALEGTGFMVNELASAAGMDYFIDAKSIIFFGAIAYDRA